VHHVSRAPARERRCLTRPPRRVAATCVPTATRGTHRETYRCGPCAWPKSALLHSVVGGRRGRRGTRAKGPRHARNSVTRRNFLFLTVHRKGTSSGRLCVPTAAVPAVGQKPPMNRHFGGYPRKPGEPAGRSGCRPRRHACWAFEAQTKGVGLAFVRLRGYGRRCWLVL
jgi:hypothetical protein